MKKIKCEIETSLTVKDLLEAGSHFGHQTRKWHPKVFPYLIGEKNSIHIIDVSKTLESIRKVGTYVLDAIKNDKRILFVGTKPQAKDVIEYVANDCGECFVKERWTGGLLTNPSSRIAVKKIKEMDETLENKEIGLKKKEIAILKKKREKIFKVFQGIMDMDELPSVLIVVDVKREALAISEAKILGIPVIGIVDTNGNPDVVDLPIVMNDDSVKSISTVLGEIGAIISQMKSQVLGSKEIAEDEMKAKIAEDSK